ncbi:Solute carrier family 35 member F4 [Apodemus speciosus]|uniref:Solute carrier family 35 member F4 n=1 Tax=Apodemus speciosus TaxID=105296 RepID=A0ABQ0FHR4_APOSI
MVPPDHQLLDANQDPTAPVPTATSAGNCPLCQSRKILLLLFLNFRAEDPLEFVVEESRDRADQWDDGTQTHPESSSQENGLKARCLSCTSMVLKTIWGLLIILSVSSSWVGTTQIFRECSRIFGEDGLTLKLFLKRTAPFSILWTLTNYLYLLALKKLTATDVSALFCCNKAFVFLLSWIVLKDRFMGVRIVAAIMAITGIVMMAYADNFHADSIIGVAFAVGSASTSALYKVLFKMFLGSANFGEAAHFVSTLGFFNLIFISFTPIILYFTKVEHWSSFAALPWGCLCGMAGLWLGIQHPGKCWSSTDIPNTHLHWDSAQCPRKRRESPMETKGIGAHLTVKSSVMKMQASNRVLAPHQMILGELWKLLGREGTEQAVDLLKQEVIFNVVRLAATIIICIGFLLMLLPEEWDEITLRFINSLKEKKSEEHVEDLTDVSVHLRSRSRVNGTVSIPLA